MCGRDGIRAGYSLGLVWVLATCASPASAQQAISDVLTLRDAVQLAVRQSPATEDARSLVEQERLTENLAAAAFRPKFRTDFSSAFGQEDLSNQNYLFSASQLLGTGTTITAGLTALSQRNQLGTYFSSDTSIGLTQPLLRGYGAADVRDQRRAAAMRVSAAERQATRAAAEIALEVADAYFSVITAAKMVGVADDALSRAQRLQDASTAKLAVGKVSRLDALRAAQLAGQAQLQRDDAASAMDSAKERLLFLVGKDPSAQLRTTTDIGVVPDWSWSEDEAVQIAVSSRPEIAAGRDALDIARLDVAAARRELLPRADVSVSARRQGVGPSFPASLSPEEPFKFAAYATVSMPLDRVAERTALGQALLRADNQQRDVEELRRRVTLQVRQSFRDRTRARAHLLSAQSEAGLANDERQIASLRFERGLSNNLDVVNAESNVLAAELRVLTAQAELALSGYRLRASVGVLNPADDFQ